jgi:hypothetical protein
MSIVTTEPWPELPLAAWADTYATLHRWLQIVGKARMVLTPPVNHSWHTTLYVSPRGLTTSAIPTATGNFEVEFDFVDHVLAVRTSDGAAATMRLEPKSVAAFYEEFMGLLRAHGIPCEIYPRPNELPDATPFYEDHDRASYDPEYANRFWRILVSTDRVLRRFRSSFVGKCSPVHFFWGAADLAVTRFSGRPAPEHPGGIPHLPDAVVQEAYSHEVSSAGFWPGGGAVDSAAFYAYAYPEPRGFGSAPVRPDGAFYHSDLREFLLPYDQVRQSPTPDDTLMAFLESTYEAAATLGAWDRAALERK